MRTSLLLVLTFVLAVPAAAQLSVERAFPNLTFSSPVGLEHDPVDASRLYVVEQSGVIRVFENDPGVTSAAVFLNLTDRVTSGGEMGLLGLAFHPDYAENGYLYVNYTTGSGSSLRSRISRFSRSDSDPDAADPASELVLLEIPQPFSNHNGGGLAFGPDGYLYASFGDGGSGGDPQEHGQNPMTLLGTILRLDVDGGGSEPDCGGAEANYTVPDNALNDGPGGDSCDEIYAWGLRNPWRFSFDRETGQGWIADVGQNQLEEINHMENGGNYGWNTYEGTACFDGPCDPEGFTFPVWEYDHSLGCSITGGYVYRGATVPELAGKYVYGDYCTGRLWALSAAGGRPQNELLDVGTYGGLTSFGEDASGELYLVRSNGQIYRFFSETTSVEPDAAAERTRLEVQGPNPFQSRTVLQVTAAEGGPARVVAYDMQGREADVLFDGTLAPGQPTPVVFDAGQLPAGVYLVRLEAGGQTVTQKVVRLR